MGDVLMKISDLLIDRKENDNRDYSYLHPSEIGGCPRALYFKATSTPENDNISASDLFKFDVGHWLHERVQTYCRDANVLMLDEVVSISSGESKVAFEMVDGEFVLIDNKRIPKERIIIKGKIRDYPYIPGTKVWLEGCQRKNPWTPVEELREGDKWYLAEVPFEWPDMHLAGHVDGLVMEHGEPTVLEIKSINNKGFWYLFFDDQAKFTYQLDRPEDKKCHICGKGMKYGENLASHLVGCHNPLGKPIKKHIIQANAYMDAMSVEKVLFWYENKDNQQILDIIEDRDADLIKGIKNLANNLWDLIEKRKLPKKPSWANGADCFGCYYCPFDYICWPSSDAAFEEVLKGIKNGKT